MPHTHLRITDQIATELAGQQGLPRDGTYRKVRLPDGRWAMLLRRQSKEHERGWFWSLDIEKPLEGPIKIKRNGKAT